MLVDPHLKPCNTHISVLGIYWCLLLGIYGSSATVFNPLCLLKLHYDLKFFAHCLDRCFHLTKGMHKSLNKYKESKKDNNCLGSTLKISPGNSKLQDQERNSDAENLGRISTPVVGYREGIPVASLLRYSTCYVSLSQSKTYLLFHVRCERDCQM